MSGRILILGAAGRLGRAAAEAFHDAGWTVVSQVRPGAGWRAAASTIVVEDDGLHKEAIVEAAAGADVILNALNLPFTQWKKGAVATTDVAIAAAEAAGATLLFPGNIYNYGKPLPEQIDETTPMHPTARKGALRVEMENRMRQASARGVKTIILRAGDFFGGTGRGSWFDLVIARDVSLGVVRYPGPLDLVHAWAYLPDLARTFVRLAEARDKFGSFETFGFSGHGVTGEELINALQQALGRQLKRKNFPWWALQLGSPLVAQWRELAELAYLWQAPHRISGDRLRAAIGEVPKTPFTSAIRTALDPLSR